MLCTNQVSFNWCSTIYLIWWITYPNWLITLDIYIFKFFLRLLNFCRESKVMTLKNCMILTELACLIWKTSNKNLILTNNDYLELSVPRLFFLKSQRIISKFCLLIKKNSYFNCITNLTEIIKIHITVGFFNDHYAVFSWKILTL